MRAPWPPGVLRVPDEDWTRRPLEDLAVKYDTVERHGWYSNLDPTVDALEGGLDPGDLVLDYSGGTGILIDRLVSRLGDRDVGVMNVDASPKFLRLSLEKFREDPRVAFRLIRYRKELGRLEYVDEVLPPALVARGFDWIVSTNAIHLYYDLAGTLSSWARVVAPGGTLHVQSGNIRRGQAHAQAQAQGTEAVWIIDDTVEAVHDAAVEIALGDPAFGRFRAALADARRRAAYDAHRRKHFLPVRPIEAYVDAIETAGFRVRAVEHRAIPVKASDWYEFLAVYHDGILGWAGGSEKVEGRPPEADDVSARLALLRRAVDRVLSARFEAEWTYITAEKPDRPKKRP
ncbi:MAG: class I SAM-dependent methyltransferase [Methanobacteriota archaeon]